MGYDNLSELLDNKKKIAVIANEIDTFDKSSAFSALVKYLQELKKELTVIILSVSEEERAKSPLEQYDINHTNQITSQSYVISIDYTKNDIEKITQDTDEEEGKILFYVYPEEGAEFSFESVQFEKKGANFDGVVLFDTPDLDDLGSFYQKNKKSFKGRNIYSMNLENNFSKRVTEILRYKNEGRENKFNSTSAQALLNGLVFSSEAEVGNDYLDKNYSLVDYLVSLGASISEAIQKTFEYKCEDFAIPTAQAEKIEE